MPFGVERVESKARFARPRNACNDDEFAARNKHIDVFEVVRSCAFDENAVGGLWCGWCHV